MIDNETMPIVKSEPVGPQHSAEIQQQANDLLAPFQEDCQPDAMPIPTVLWRRSTGTSSELVAEVILMRRPCNKRVCLTLWLQHLDSLNWQLEPESSSSET